jgi:hypothetical protein
MDGMSAFDPCNFAKIINHIALKLEIGTKSKAETPDNLNNAAAVSAKLLQSFE